MLFRSQMMEQIEQLIDSKSVYQQEARLMALDSLKAYLEFHRTNEYSDSFCEQLEAFVGKYFDERHASYGGVIEVKKSDLKFNTEEIESFFRSRHSVRDFSKTPVDTDSLNNALHLAQTAPSACNRQGVRAYVISHEKSLDMAKQLVGIGGFAESVDRFILITGKTSAYRFYEINQFIVSASIYIGYLSLTLHLYGIGACIVQRPVVWTKMWEKMKKSYCIPEDEQEIGRAHV